MEEGKIATVWAQFGATERSPSMYIRMRVLPWSNTLLARGRLGSISALGEPASRFTSAIERSGKWKKVRQRLGYSLVRLERSPNVYKNACATLSNTF
jgi:hypothetical protein